MTEKIFELKTLLRAKATEIKDTKSKLKKSQDGTTSSLLQSTLYHLRLWYRHRHIAYCLLRGTPYELIEKPAENNPANMRLVEEVKNEYSIQTVHSGQA